MRYVIRQQTKTQEECMGLDKAFETLLDWVDSVKYLNPAQVAAIMISMGSQLSYDMATNKEEANKLIQDSVEMGWKDHLKGQ